MKKMKKIASLLLALVVVLAMTIPAFAAGTGKITITNASKGQTYAAYKVFDLESYDTTNNLYIYKVASEWADFMTTGKGATWVKVDTENDNVVTWTAADDKTTKKAFSEAVISYAEAKNISATDSDTADSDNDTITFSNLELGYYVVDSTLGTLCALTTTNPNASVVEKNTLPTLAKTVKEDSTGVYGATNTADFGEVVEFQVVITVQGIAKGYVMHDKMDPGFTFDSSSVSIKKTSGSTDTNLVSGTDYNVSTNADSCTFDINFTAACCEALKSGDKITVDYKATLNKDATVGSANINTAYLTYNDYYGDPAGETTESSTLTYTYEIPVYKYANGDTSVPLADAGFTLYTDEDCTQALKFTQVQGAEEYKLDASGSKVEIKTTSTGAFTLKGLDAGTYYLKETSTPAGYNKLDTVVTVTIAENGNVNGGVARIEVNNTSGTILPETGGIGTTIFYIIGGALVVGVVVAFTTKRRMRVK